MLENQIRKNGDGTLTVSKTIIAFWTLMILILGTIIPAAIAYGKLNEDVNVLQEDWNELEPQIRDVDKYISASEVKIENIQDDISEIKTDIKEIKQELKNRKMMITR